MGARSLTLFLLALGLASALAPTASAALQDHVPPTCGNDCALGLCEEDCGLEYKILGLTVYVVCSGQGTYGSPVRFVPGGVIIYYPPSRYFGWATNCP